MNAKLLRRILETTLIAPWFSVCLMYSMAGQTAGVSNDVSSIPSGQWDRFKQAAEGKNTPITFYGMVIDQDSNALAGVNVKLRVQQVKFHPHYFVLPNYIQFNRTTGTNGRFFLDGVSGRGVDITSIVKDGYKLEPNAIFDYGADSGTSSNPIVFVLWARNEKNSMFSGDRYFRFIPDGRAYAINLSNQNIGPATKFEGDFQFRLKRTKGVHKWDKFDWSFDFEGENGNALMRANEGYFGMLFAPRDGYTSTYNESHRLSDSPWIENGQQQFYIKLRGGKEYGRLLLAWDTVAATAGPNTNEAGIRIQYTINPTGSPLVR